MQYTVITSIQAPTDAVRAFASRQGEKLVVAGDLKTPPDWNCAGAVYLGPHDPAIRGFTLAKKLPYNHYCRKNLGYLYAMAQGATAIYETDDDNIPLPGHGFPEQNGTYDCVSRDNDWVNVYQFFAPDGSPNIWPRGYPLNLILRREDMAAAPKSVSVAIWQGLADQEPDVDAIYRLTCNAPYTFKKRDPLVLEKGAWCPFNTQNTLFYPAVYPLLYVPSTVSFRFADILRSVVCTATLHRFDMCLGFTQASVKQIRNIHNYMEDFKSEIPMFLQINLAKEVAIRAVADGNSIEDCMLCIYRALFAENIVQTLEIELAEAWLDDCKHIRG